MSELKDAIQRVFDMRYKDAKGLLPRHLIDLIAAEVEKLPIRHDRIRLRIAHDRSPQRVPMKNTLTGWKQ